jgi:replicative DNA helicase
MVDFIQRFNPPDGRVNRAAFYSDLANEFKEIALNRKIVVFVASQFSRDIEKQDDREPLLSDLKESGGIEEASDKVFLLKARPDNPMSPTRGLKIYLKKNRQGPTGIFYFKFEKSKTKFHESTEADYDTGAEVGTVGSDEENSRGMEGKMAASGETWNFL